MNGPGYSFVVRYKNRKTRRICEISDSVRCHTVQEARRWMMESVRVVELTGGTLVEARTYRAEV